MNAPQSTAIPDVQSSADLRQIAINRVGIKGIRHPIKVQDKSVGVQHTIATFNMYVHLPHNFKGTHMSRFVEILNEHEREISVESFEGILQDMVTRLEAQSGYIEMNFPYFINKTAPVSGVQSLLDYDVTLIGEIVAGKTRMTLKVLRACDQLVPLLQENLGTWRTQPTLSRHLDPAHQPFCVDRRRSAYRRRTSLVRVIRPTKTPR